MGRGRGSGRPTRARYRTGSDHPDLPAKENTHFYEIFADFLPHSWTNMHTSRGHSVLYIVNFSQPDAICNWQIPETQHDTRSQEPQFDWFVFSVYSIIQSSLFLFTDSLINTLPYPPIYRTCASSASLFLAISDCLSSAEMRRVPDVEPVDGRKLRR